MQAGQKEAKLFCQREEILPNILETYFARGLPVGHPDLYSDNFAAQ